MKAYLSTPEWLARQQARIARDMERKQAEREAPPEVLRRVVNGQPVVTRSVRHAR
jgi:hypothetical protein